MTLSSRNSTKDIQIGDIVLTAPISALRITQTVPKNISTAIGTISVNGLLAAEFALDTSEIRSPWQTVLPTKDNFEESIPFLWHPSLQALLPPGATTLLESQGKKIVSDWTAVSKAFPDLSFDHYVYNWFLVSTRTFYYTPPKPKKKLHRDDCLALIPLADNFNHADVGCEVTYSATGYQIIADRRYMKGEEMYISYGDHNNDFLLAEYGFVLEENKWDSICLDELLLPLFSEAQKQELKDAGFYGKFILDEHRICYRTQVAIRLLRMPVGQWQRLVANGLDENNKYQEGIADGVLLGVLTKYKDSVAEKLEQVKVLDCGFKCPRESQREMLTRRWQQIQRLLDAALERIDNK